jgi:formyltetrahydrofolate deformylase
VYRASGIHQRTGWHLECMQTDVGERYQMRFAFRGMDRLLRGVIAVSRQGHCLNSLSHRWATGSLPVQIHQPV